MNSSTEWQRPHARTLLGHAKLAREVGEHAELLVAMPARDLAQAVCERMRGQVDLLCACDCVWVEPHAFAEGLYELVHNAVRAAKGRSPVTIEVRDISDGDALWQIRDDGEGMSEHALAGLGAVGFGRGVALAWAIVEKHGGLLRFESTPGVGTTATIWLPGCR